MTWIKGSIPSAKLGRKSPGEIIEGKFNVQRPKPLDIAAIPPGTRPKFIDTNQHLDYNAVDQYGNPQDNESLMRSLLWNSDIDILLRTLGTAFTPRLITINPATTSTPTEIIQTSRMPRGYIILNPGEISGVTNEVTFFPSATRTTAGSPYTSTAFNVTGVDTARLFLNISAVTGAVALQVNAQTQDPLSGNFATSQSDIFGGASTVGTFYASLGQLGVDRTIRLLATLTGGTDMTFSISGLLKGTVPNVIGTTVFIGGPDVNRFHGYPILAGNKETFFLKENTTLFAITATETLVLKVFQLQ